MPSLLPSPIYFSSRPRFTATIICFYVRSWKSFRLSRTSPLLSSSPLSPCPARFPLAETSRVLFLPSPREKFKRGGNLRDSLSLPPPPPSRGIRGERRKADRKFRSLWIKVFSKLPFPSLATPILLYQSKLQVRGFAETEEEELWTMFSIFVVVLNLSEKGEGGQVFGNEILFQDCKINRERSPGLTLDWILTLWKCLIDIISVRMESLQGGMLGWFTRDWRRRVLFPSPHPLGNVVRIQCLAFLQWLNEICLKMWW